MTQTTAGTAGHQQTPNKNQISQETLGSKSCDRTNPHTETRQVASDWTEDTWASTEFKEWLEDEINGSTLETEIEASTAVIRKHHIWEKWNSMWKFQRKKWTSQKQWGKMLINACNQKASNLTLSIKQIRHSILEKPSTNATPHQTLRKWGTDCSELNDNMNPGKKSEAQTANKLLKTEKQ